MLEIEDKNTMYQKNCFFKKIEYALQTILLICYLMGNLFYYRRFHYISFFLLFIIWLKNSYHLATRKLQLLPKDLRKVWKLTSPMYVIGFLIMLDILLCLPFVITGESIYALSEFASLITMTLPFQIAVCLIIGDIKQHIAEQENGLQKQFVHLYSAIFQWCLLAVVILIAVSTDMFYSTTRVRYYEEDLAMYNISESKGLFFPDTIPKEAKNIEYYRTPGVILSDYSHQLRLKMTVTEDYILHLEDLYENVNLSWNNDPLKITQDCSVLTQANYKEYFFEKDLTENIGEYYGKENCIVYFIYDADMGFVINYDTCEVKLFLDYNL